MKKIPVILAITITFATLTAVGCSKTETEETPTTTTYTEITFQEPTVDISESVSVTFKKTTETTKKKSTTPKTTTKPNNKKTTTKYIPLVTTKNNQKATEYVEPATEQYYDPNQYYEPETEYIAPTTAYVPPTTAYVAPTTAYVAPTTKPAPKPSPSYIDYSTVSSTYLTANDAATLTSDQIQSLINDIYAHHGYIFKTPALKEYYESQSWYNGTTTSEAVCEASFNDCEERNKNLLSRYR